MTAPVIAEYNPFDPDFYPKHAFATYRWLLDEAPVWRSPRWGWYALTRFEDVRGALLDPDLYRSFEGMDIDNTFSGADGERRIPGQHRQPAPRRDPGDRPAVVPAAARRCARGRRPGRGSRPPGQVARPGICATSPRRSPGPRRSTSSSR